MSNPVIQQQIEYYRLRASEYDEWFYRVGRYDYGTVLNQQWFDEVAIVQDALHQLEPVDHILELACGTGIWTQELLKLGERITAIDASAEVIELNRQKVNSPRVTYHQLDLFQWEPKEEYDLVFFSFWLSHVPPDLLTAFLQKVYRSLRRGGRVFIIDSRFEPTSTATNHTLAQDSPVYQTRKLNNGQEYQIVKIFYQPDELHDRLIKTGFASEIKVTENYFIYVNARKS